MNCEHPNIKDEPVNNGECACGCRDYQFCPECEEAIEVDNT